MNTSVYRITLLFIILSAVTVQSFAQPPDTLGTYHWDYNDFYEQAMCVKAVPSGGYIATGYTYFETSVQVWTARMDQDMNEIWLNIEGEEGTDGAYYIEPTSDGGFIQCGETWSIPGHGADGYVRKLSANGEQEWLRVYGTTSVVEYFSHVREAPSGGYIAVGNVNYLQLYRMNNSGTVIWTWHDPEVFASPHWVEPSADGGFIVASDSWYDPGDDRVSTIYKVSAAGETLWMNDEADFGLPMGGYARCVREGADGSIYVCGSAFRSETYYDFYVSKRNPDGSIIWSIFITDPTYAYDTAYDITLLADGNIAVTGISNDEETLMHSWLVKFSPDGDILWFSDLSFWDDAMPTSVDQGRDGSIVSSYYIEPGINNPNEISFIKWEPEVEIELQTWTPVIPETGGWLRYGAQVSNILLDPTPLDAWIVVTGPNGNRELVNHFPITLQPGTTWTRPHLNVRIPGGYPNGTYTYEINIGDGDTRRNMGLGSFTFVKGE
jgi:hypothetical protein